MTKASKWDLIHLLKYLYEDHETFYEKLTPEGWVNQPLIYFIHPTPQQKWEEALQAYTSLRRLDEQLHRKTYQKKPELADFKSDDPTNINPIDEFRYLLAIGIYEIFSHNHEVRDDIGKIYDMGSMRGTGKFLAEFLNMYYPTEWTTYDYMDFYYQYFAIQGRGDMSPIFRYVFQKMQARKLSWLYATPRIYAYNLSADRHDDIDAIDPHRRVSYYLRKIRPAQGMDHVVEEINEALQRDVLRDIPRIVEAYRSTFGEFPSGWPDH